MESFGLCPPDLSGRAPGRRNPRSFPFSNLLYYLSPNRPGPPDRLPNQPGNGPLTFFPRVSSVLGVFFLVFSPVLGRPEARAFLFFFSSLLPCSAPPLAPVPRQARLLFLQGPVEALDREHLGEVDDDVPHR